MHLVPQLQTGTSVGLASESAGNLLVIEVRGSPVLLTLLNHFHRQRPVSVILNAPQGLTIFSLNTSQSPVTTPSVIPLEMETLRSRRQLKLESRPAPRTPHPTSPASLQVLYKRQRDSTSELCQNISHT